MKKRRRSLSGPLHTCLKQRAAGRIDQLQAENLLPCLQQGQENAISLPQREVHNLFLRNPLQHAFAAFRKRGVLRLGGVEERQFISPVRQDECENAAEAQVPKLQSGLLADFPADAFLRGFVLLQVAARSQRADSCSFSVREPD